MRICLFSFAILHEIFLYKSNTAKSVRFLQQNPARYSISKGLLVGALLFNWRIIILTKYCYDVANRACWVAKIKLFKKTDFFVFILTGDMRTEKYIKITLVVKIIYNFILVFKPKNSPVSPENFYYEACLVVTWIQM